MKIAIVYKPYSDHARECEEWIREFEKRSSGDLEILNPELPDGESFCVARDIVEYPTIAAVGEDGKTYESWSGTPLPVIDEVIGYIVR
ncbi:hypothetical protein IKE71_00100 [Candidatus Saccharibacteria bacterium]|nr:hypothetical protein [Candidatus Saccharibacteria bacterium]